MTLRVYRSTSFLSRSVLQAELVAEIDRWPEDAAAFARLRWRHHRRSTY